MKSKNQAVVVLGASAKPERYSNKALKSLKEKGHRAIPIHPVLKQIEGLTVLPSLKDVTDKIDTLTVYLAPSRSEKLISDIIVLHPNRVILNPGAESDDLEKSLADHGIPVLRACTLVLLQTNQF